MVGYALDGRGLEEKRFAVSGNASFKNLTPVGLRVRLEARFVASSFLLGRKVPTEIV